MKPNERRREMKPIQKSIVYLMLVAFVLAGFLAACASPQTGSMKKTELSPQITGKLGSPSATTTISGKQLPPPRRNSVA